MKRLIYTSLLLCFLKPSKIGDVVKATAEVTKVDGKKIEFKVSAYSGETGTGFWNFNTVR